MTTDRVLRLPQVMAATGMSKVSVYRRVADGSFPKQIKLGPRLVGWRESDGNCSELMRSAGFLAVPRAVAK